jgi:hypothetical protein
MAEINLGRLDYSPDVNPLAEMTEIKVKNRQVRTGGVREMVSTSDGQVHQYSVVLSVEEVDDIHFVKVFADGIKATYDLTKPAHKVFQAVLQVYQSTPMRGGYVDQIYLFWVDGGLGCGQLNMSHRSYRRGLVELLEKGFLSPCKPNLFWVNPNLFFKGNRAIFTKEYRKKMEEKRRSQA